MIYVPDEVLLAIYRLGSWAVEQAGNTSDEEYGDLSREWKIVEVWIDGLPAMPQPDWDEAPESAGWHAIDPDGLGYWFPAEPFTAFGTWYIESGREKKSGYYTLPLGIDWRQTLTKRPPREEEE